MTTSSSHSPVRGSASQNPTHQRRPHNVTAARARAQRAKLHTQIQAREIPQQSKRKKTDTGVPARNQTSTSIADAIEAYLQDHSGGNHSPKTLEWHTTALGLLRRYLEEERTTTWIEEVDAPALSAWFTYLRTVPGQRGKPQYGPESRQNHRRGISQASRNHSPYQAADGGPTLVDDQVGAQRPSAHPGRRGLLRGNVEGGHQHNPGYPTDSCNQAEYE